MISRMTAGCGLQLALQKPNNLLGRATESQASWYNRSRRRLGTIRNLAQWRRRVGKDFENTYSQEWDLVCLVQRSFQSSLPPRNSYSSTPRSQASRNTR